jgi:circadian clock protein KaiC
VTVHYHDARECLRVEAEQSVFRPAEVELPRTVETMLSVIERVDPQRLIIDSLSEIRLLAADARWYRRQILALKDDLSRRQCTTLLCDDRTGVHDSKITPAQSIVHGVINLERYAPDYGPQRRRLEVVKLRGQPFSSGYHDMKIRTGGIDVFPRLIAAEHREPFPPGWVESGLPELDAMLGGGIDRGTSTLLLGTAGSGKSSLAAQYALAAAQRGERSALAIFDERTQTLLQRTRGLGMDLDGPIERGLIEARQIDPAEVTPGEFSHDLLHAVEDRNVRLVVIDSLSGYMNAMPDERLLTIHLHELLSYLCQQGVTVLLTMTQHGLPGSPARTMLDFSYLSDNVMLLRHFEYTGEVRKVISVYKRRGGAHERTIRELDLDAEGIHIGRPLEKFHGILTGIPRFIGEALPSVPTSSKPDIGAAGAGI